MYTLRLLSLFVVHCCLPVCGVPTYQVTLLLSSISVLIGKNARLTQGRQTEISIQTCECQVHKHHTDADNNAKHSKPGQNWLAVKFIPIIASNNKSHSLSVCVSSVSLSDHQKLEREARICRLLKHPNIGELRVLNLEIRTLIQTTHMFRLGLLWIMLWLLCRSG